MDQELLGKEDSNFNSNHINNNNNHNNNIKHISFVPDYRVMQIIDEQTKQLNKILMNCDPIIRSISKRDDFKSFRSSLQDVQKYLKQNSLTSINSLDQNSSIELIKEIKQLFPYGSGTTNNTSSSLLSTDEIVMLLNQMPNNESMVELLFPGKFSKEQIQQLLLLMQKYTKQIEPESESKTSTAEDNRHESDEQETELLNKQQQETIITSDNNIKNEPIDNQMEINPSLTTAIEMIDDQQQIKIKSED